MPELGPLTATRTSATGVVVPFPLSATAFGLLAALLGTVRLAPRDPAWVGAKRTPTVQLLLGATLAFEQVSLPRLKSPGFEPPSESWPSVSDWLPLAAVLVIVTVCDVLVEPTSWSPKLTLDGLTPTVGGDVPFPLSATVSGLLAALLGTDRLAMRDPAWVGVNRTSTLQLCPTPSVLPVQRSLPSTKSAASTP